MCIVRGSAALFPVIYLTFKYGDSLFNKILINKIPNCQIQGHYLNEIS